MFQSLEEKFQRLQKKRPLSPSQVAQLKKYYDVEFTYHSNAIEGNTLTITETKVILEDGITVGKGKSLKEHLEVINHKEAIDYIQEVVDQKLDLSESVIKNIHHLILKSIDNPNAGIYRKNNVLISGSAHRPPEFLAIHEEMEGILNWYHKNKDKLPPIALAAEFHFRFVYIHPFIDGNGRTARLLMNLILLQNGYPLTVITMEERSEYMAALEVASTTGLLENFITIISLAVEKSLDTYLYLID